VRRRLALLSLATTTLVVVSLLVPLGLLVRRQAADRARVQAEREAQSIAGLIGLAVTIDPSAEALEAAIGTLEEGQIVVLADGSVIGLPQAGQGSLVGSARADQATITMVVDGGWEIALPVISREGSVVVDVFVTDGALTEGVLAAWVSLAALGVVLVGAAVLVADRLGASLVGPITDLATAARRMGDGDLDARVEPSDPEELRDVGEAFNQLARRLDQLLVEERESVADLSHRLRTPLTSLRLQAEKIADQQDRAEVISQVDRIEQAIDQLIVAARAGSRGEGGACVLDDVVDDRAAFWQVLAVEQSREMTLETDAAGVRVDVTRESLEALIDALVGNVFEHTAQGTSFAMSTGEEDGLAWLEISDTGPGFSDGSLLQRGQSGGGSTGLGLDIARRTAELTGGRLEVSNGPHGGRVRVWFAWEPSDESP
jgi:signal transduction histidine kinase